ncbi:MAG: DUF664 domain-containing protein [Aggregatilineales bacterium]
MDTFFEDYLLRLDDLHEDFKIAIGGLSVDVLDWVPEIASKDSPMNSLCVLVVHVCGAARYWCGDVALGEISNRDRNAEFEAKGYTEQDLIAKLDDNIAYFRTGFAKLSVHDLARSCPAPGRTIRPNSTQLREYNLGWSLLHALEHTGLHLGHAEITRQLWDSEGQV